MPPRPFQLILKKKPTRFTKLNLNSAPGDVEVMQPHSHYWTLCPVFFLLHNANLLAALFAMAPYI